MNSIGSVSLVLACAFTSVTAANGNELEIIDAITDNVTAVCDKPQSAGSHWDIRVKGDGEAGLRLKLLPKLGGSGEVEFTQQEWTCLLYTSPSPRDLSTSRMPSSA